MKFKLGQPVKILIVEDSNETADTARRAFAADRVQIDHAANDHDALEMARLGGYDLILIDFLLPGRSGLELGVEMRKSAGLRSTPILLQTESPRVSEGDPDVRGTLSGLLGKPLVPDHWRAALSALT